MCFHYQYMRKLVCAENKRRYKYAVMITRNNTLKTVDALTIHDMYTAQLPYPTEQ